MTYRGVWLFLMLAWMVMACGKPEEELADHMQEMTAIMESHMDSPEAGVEELRGYLHENLPHMMHELGEMVVELDGIEDDAERKDRLEAMLEVLKGPGEELAEVAQSFSRKVREDEAAMKAVEGVMKRLGSLGPGAYFDYMDRSRSVEAEMGLKALGDGALAYFQMEHVSPNNPMEVTTGVFPSAPAWTCTEGDEGEVSPWLELRFEVSEPGMYRYCYRSHESGRAFAARAEGAGEEVWCLTGAVVEDDPVLGAILEVSREACEVPEVR